MMMHKTTQISAKKVASQPIKKSKKAVNEIKNNSLISQRIQQKKAAL
jgi:hypothetical protein